MTRAVLALAVVAVGCVAGDLGAPRAVPALDRDAFRCRVEPVLAARCAFLACHGDEARPFRVYAPGRLRLGVAVDAALTAAEREANYAAALGMAGDEREPPLLVGKPLDTAAGGFYHGGQARFDGDDVFATTADPGYVALADWIAGATADPGCTP